MEAPLLKIVERLAEVCDLGETERSWLVDKVTAEASRSGRQAAVLRSEPSAHELDAKIGGASTTDAKSTRRSLYLFQKREAPPLHQTLAAGQRDPACADPRKNSRPGVALISPQGWAQGQVTGI